MKIKHDNGFTLVEILVVVLILGFILSIAVPDYINSTKKSRRTLCIANLQKIDSAVDAWALEKSVSAGTAISTKDEGDIYNDYVRGSRPKCPAGGVYTLHTVGVKPQVTCSKQSEGHKLE